MKYLLELHAHTSETSNCGHLTAEELVTLHKQAGYASLVTTDHCCAGQWPRRLSGQARADAFLKGYRRARRAGVALGVRVLLGMEARLYNGPEDYLLYGLSEEDVPALIGWIDCARDLREFYDRVHSRGLLLIQAHPNRPGLRPADARYLDGYEILNANPRHDSENEKTRAYVEGLADDTLIQTAGSDVHRVEDVAGTGILSPVDIADNASLVAYLKENPRPAFRESFI